MKTLLRSLFLCFTILPVATYSQNVQTSAIPTANCSFTLFDVGSSGATRPGRINRWHNTIGNAESIGNFESAGTREFLPPNPGEMLDWVLVLDDAAKNYPAPGSKSLF